MEFEKPKRMQVGLDISPLIDIVFQLLLFFMLTSNFVTESGFKLNLPRAQTASRQEDKTPVILFIDGQERVFVDQEEIQLDQLTQVLDGEFQSRQSKTVVLKADESVPMGVVVRVMDLARQAKGENLIVSTQKYHETAEAR